MGYNEPENFVIDMTNITAIHVVYQFDEDPRLVIEFAGGVKSLVVAEACSYKRQPLLHELEARLASFVMIH